MQSVRLPSGEVLLIGGYGREDGITMRLRAELYDPLTRRTQLVGEPRVGRIWQTATLMNDERVLVAGGAEYLGSGWGALGLVDILDLRTFTWTSAPQLQQPRSDHAATLLKDGRVLVAGGHVGPTTLSSVEIYDPVANAWSYAAPLPLRRWSFSMTTLPDGRVLAAGGFADRGLQTDTTVIYDPLTNTWTDGPRMLSERANHTTVVLRDGDLLLIGGQRAGAGTAERYDLRLGTFVPAGALVQPRMFAQAAERGDGSVVLVGGILRPESGEGFVPNAYAEVWERATNTWRVLAQAPTARAGGQAVLVDGAVCVFGGSAENDLPVNAIECLR